ncbi:MAG: dihydroorotate dehydrogenase-like protein [Acidobacteria bacterium]|nr:MAG: dihydroorotate dehydrogenase-like protein [Acidobacteriota bacterium]
MIDLSTEYLGLRLRTPVVPSPSPLCESLDNLRRMEDAGAGAVVLHSLFEEQINIESHDLDTYLSHGTESYAEAVSYFPDMGAYNTGPEGYLEHVRRAKEALGIPVIGSLNGVSTGGWIRYAKKIAEAGADALELNVYFLPTDSQMTSTDVEAMYINLVRDLTAGLEIPVAVKISPFFSAPVHFAREAVAAGARGLVLFNRFYQPDLDIEALEVKPDLDLSRPETLRLRLRWVAIMHGRVDADLAVTGGVHSGADVIKCMMAGAKVAMTASALLIHGVRHIATMLDEVRAFMEEKEYESIAQMQGSMSQRAVAEPAAFERANYMKVLRSFALRSGGGPA